VVLQNAGKAAVDAEMKALEQAEQTGG
jgi:hypothetical protein